MEPAVWGFVGVVVGGIITAVVTIGGELLRGWQESRLDFGRRGPSSVICDTPRGYVLSIGLVCASLVGLVGCGSSTATTPPSAAAAPPAVTPSAATPRPNPVVGGVCTPTPIKFDPKAIDLTGAWASDDTDINYVRQLGTVVWWNGMSSRNDPPELLGRRWNSVGRGEIKDDLTIAADWVDVPRGKDAGHGTVVFKIGADSAGNLQITKTSETGTGRGDTVWTRCTPGFPPG